MVGRGEGYTRCHFLLAGGKVLGLCLEDGRHLFLFCHGTAQLSQCVGLGLDDRLGDLFPT